MFAHQLELSDNYLRSSDIFVNKLIEDFESSTLNGYKLDVKKTK